MQASACWHAHDALQRYLYARCRVGGRPGPRCRATGDSPSAGDTHGPTCAFCPVAQAAPLPALGNRAGRMARPQIPIGDTDFPSGPLAPQQPRPGTCFTPLFRKCTRAAPAGAGRAPRRVPKPCTRTYTGRHECSRDPARVPLVCLGGRGYRRGPGSAPANRRPFEGAAVPGWARRPRGLGHDTYTNVVDDPYMLSVLRTPAASPHSLPPWPVVATQDVAPGKGEGMDVVPEGAAARETFREGDCRRPDRLDPSEEVCRHVRDAERRRPSHGADTASGLPEGV